MEPLIDESSKSDQIGVIVKYFRLHRGTHVGYALKYFACEILNFVNVISQIYFLDFFLGFEFASYGLDVINYTEQPGMQFDRPDPMHKVFPKVTKSLLSLSLFFKKYVNQISIIYFDRYVLPKQFH